MDTEIRRLIDHPETVVIRRFLASPQAGAGAGGRFGKRVCITALDGDTQRVHSDVSARRTTLHSCPAAHADDLHAEQASLA